jgi:hypothetical protein
MALLQAGELMQSRERRTFQPCTPLLVCDFLNGPGCPKVVCHGTATAAEPTESMGIVLHNKTQKLLWTVLANFQFRSPAPEPPHEPVYKTRCGQFSTDRPLPPGSSRRLSFRFGVGRCPSKEQKEAQMDEEARQEGRHVPPRPRSPYKEQLTTDEVVEYSFEIQAWVAYPWPELLLSPDERQTVRGKLTVPQGTPADYCIHHFVYSLTSE